MSSPGAMVSGNVSIITLGVSDIAAATLFYEKLGWQNTGASQDSISFLQGNSVVLALFGRAALAKDAGIVDQPGGFGGFTLAANQHSRQAVDGFFSAALAAGARTVKQPEPVFWGGYSGYFADPDGHLWEVAHNPFFAMDENGRLNLGGEQTSEK